jgi:hypothetical protein
MLEGVLPRIINDDIHVKYIVFDGKHDLEKQIEKKLKNWQLPNTKFIIIRDKDSADCLLIKSNLRQKCLNAGRNDVLIRIACSELESWYLGDLQAVESGLGIRGLSGMQNNSKYRSPDILGNAAQELFSITKKKYQKIGGSREISPYLKLDQSNKSDSFNVFIDGILDIISN